MYPLKPFQGLSCKEKIYSVHVPTNVQYVLRLSKDIVPQWMLRAGVPTKSDSDVIFCLQLLSKTFNLYTPLKLKRIDGSLVYYNTPVIYRL